MILPEAPADDLERIDSLYACPCDEATMYSVPYFPERAAGMFVWMAGDPEPYIDMVMGYSSTNFGHCHPIIVSAVQEAASKLEQVHAFHTRAQLDLCKVLVEQLGPNAADGQYRVYLDVGGSSVVEAAVRLARVFTGKPLIVCFDGAFHGVGYLSGALSDDRLLAKIQYQPNDTAANIIRLPFSPQQLNGAAELRLTPSPVTRHT